MTDRMPEWQQDLEHLLGSLGFAYKSSFLCGEYNEVSFKYENAAARTETMFIFGPEGYRLTYRCLDRRPIASVTCPAPRRRRRDCKIFRACVHLIVKAGVGRSTPQHVLDLHAIRCARVARLKAQIEALQNELTFIEKAM